MPRPDELRQSIDDAVDKLGTADVVLRRAKDLLFSNNLSAALESTRQANSMVAEAQLILTQRLVTDTLSS